jgi:hypothetical protein
MITPSSTGNNFTDSDDFEGERGRSRAFKIVSIIAALSLTAALLLGFLYWRKRHEEQAGIEQAAKAKAVRPAALQTKVQVYMDEAVRKGPQALIGGTVHNISNEKLSNLSLEIELSHRKDPGTEVRTLEVEPRDLAPDEKGRYSLTLTGDYRSFKLLHVKSGPASEAIGFKPAPGAPRPAEQAPQTTKTVIVNRPSAPKKGEEEFINTPDNPSRIP